MATVEEVVRDLLAAVDTDVGYLNAVRWIDSRYKQLLSKVRFKQQRKIGAISIPARYNTGTVDATRDSTAVTGTDSEWDTTPGNGTQTDYWIRIRSAWYRVASITNDTTLVLANAFAEEDADDLSYDIVKRHHACASTARWLGDFVFTRLRLKLGSISLEQLDAEAPGRTLVGSYPLVVAQAPHNSSGYLMVEFYPYSDTSEIIHYVYWDYPSTLSITSTIPPQIDPYILKEAALIDLYRYLKSKAYQSGRIDEGNSWRNDEMVQKTMWERHIQDAVRTDQGVDDVTFILNSFPGAPIRSGDIRNAHDYVLHNWSWPSAS